MPTNRNSHKQSPTNRNGRTVGSVLLPELIKATDVRCVVGYASINELLSLALNWYKDKKDRGLDGTFEVVLGHEPSPGKIRHVIDSSISLPKELKASWAEEGVSIALSMRGIHLLEAVKEGRVKVALADSNPMQHGKVYLFKEEGAKEDDEWEGFSGSANLSSGGMRHNDEAMLRLKLASRKDMWAYYKGAKEKSRDWTNEFVDQIRTYLIEFVSVEEALACGVARITDPYMLEEGEFNLSGYLPHQISGGIRASRALHDFSFCLVADELGSGKTRTVSAAVAALAASAQQATDRLIVAVIAPSDAVLQAWREQLSALGLPPHACLTASQLSQNEETRGSENSEAQRRLAECDVVILDEGHRFFNQKSNRTKNLKKTLALDLKLIVVTATPFNSGMSDLYAIAALRDPDAISDEQYEEIMSSIQKTNQKDALSAKQATILNGRADAGFLRELSAGTVYRSASAINKLAQEQPDSYTIDGRQFRYPKLVSHTFPLKETERDCEVALEIADLLKECQTLSIPLEGTVSESQLVAAQMPGLRVANFMDSVRSSAPAAYSRLYGVDAAAAAFDFTVFGYSGKGNTGPNPMVARRRQAAQHLPRVESGIAVPSFMSSRSAWEAACLEDVRRLEKIGNLVLELSLESERSKASLCLELMRGNGPDAKVLAFARYPISASYIASLVASLDNDIRPVVLNPEVEEDSLIAEFAPTKKGRRVACITNKFQEGINLHGSNVVLHIDFGKALAPTVQRVGRVCRINSSFAEAHSFFPDFHPAFDRGISQGLLDNLVESRAPVSYNLPLPEFSKALSGEMYSFEGEADAILESSQEFEPALTNLISIEDHTANLAALVGDDALISTGTFNRYRAGSPHPVLARAHHVAPLVTNGYPFAVLFVESPYGGNPEVYVLEYINGLSKPPKCTIDINKGVPDRLRALIPNTSHDSEALSEHADITETAIRDATRYQVRNLGPAFERYLDMLRVTAEKSFPSDQRWQNVKNLFEHFDSPDEEDGPLDFREVAKGARKYFRPLIAERGLLPDPGKERTAGGGRGKGFHEPISAYEDAIFDSGVDYEELLANLGPISRVKPLANLVYAAVVARAPGKSPA